MDNQEIGMVCIDGLEDDILSRKTAKLDFPAVCVHQQAIYFNSRCSNILNSKKIQVSKTNDYLIFREAHPASTNAFCRLSFGKGPSFCISGVRIMEATGLKPGQCFRLYSVKGGGYAIKLHEPLQVPD